MKFTVVSSKTPRSTAAYSAEIVKVCGSTRTGMGPASIAFSWAYFAAP
jgi:hypothetical protein